MDVKVFSKRQSRGDTIALNFRDWDGWIASAETQVSMRSILEFPSSLVCAPPLRTEASGLMSGVCFRLALRHASRMLWPSSHAFLAHQNREVDGGRTADPYCSR